MKSKITNLQSRRPTIFGVGLIALDIILSEDKTVDHFAGGTCGNVMSIMSHLGWVAKPISRIGHDRAAQVVRRDLERWGVDLSNLGIEPVMKTPVIVEKLRKDVNGVPFHTFSFYCPNCNRRFPGYQPVPLKTLWPLISEMSPYQVLFIDRVSPGSVALARKASELGVVIYFEPSSSSEDKNFTALLKLATIVKYSHDRIDDLGLVGSPSVLLEIQTLGRGGIRFRSKIGDFGRGWHHLQAEPLKGLIDTAGSGDWFSAGLIAALCSKGLSPLSAASGKQILSAMATGQALAAWNCGFLGARGGMYSSALPEIKAIYKAYRAPARSGKNVTISLDTDKSTIAQICEDCRLSSAKLDVESPRKWRA